MIVAVCTQIKTGTYTNVFRFGQPFGTETPYIIVKEDKDSLNRGKLIRVWCHMQPGQDLFIDKYMDGELIDLLDGFSGTDRFGNNNILRVLDEYTGIVRDNDDGTISKERRFLVPSRTF